MHDAPRITIGLVVRNGAQHLAEAIESLLAQTEPRFELVVHDNASTDETPRIVESFAAVDDRVRLVRRDVNIGAVGNMLAAVEHVATPYFCWATHDDLHEPGFLATLLGLLEAHPAASLACCAVRHIDPDGARLDRRIDTDRLETSVGSSRAARIAMYLRDAPGTPVYGLFRTDSLRKSLHVLRDECVLDGVPLIGLDMVFLADVVRRGDLAVAHEELLSFRFGGWSHRTDVYGTPRRYLAHLLGFARALRRATLAPDAGLVERCRIAFARSSFLVRWLASKPMRRLGGHYLRIACPWLARLGGVVDLVRSRPLRELARRLEGLPAGSRIALFGAGKHTRRLLPALRSVVGRRHRLIAILDDAPTVAEIDGVPVLHARTIADGRFDLVVVSSDTYEARMLRALRSRVGSDRAIWAIYDPTLERSSSSIDASSAASDAQPSAPSMRRAG